MRIFLLIICLVFKVTINAQEIRGFWLQEGDLDRHLIIEFMDDDTCEITEVTGYVAEKDSFCNLWQYRFPYKFKDSRLVIKMPYSYEIDLWWYSIYIPVSEKAYYQVLDFNKQRLLCRGISKKNQRSTTMAPYIGLGQISFKRISAADFQGLISP